MLTNRKTKTTMDELTRTESVTHGRQMLRRRTHESTTTTTTTTTTTATTTRGSRLFNGAANETRDAGRNANRNPKPLAPPTESKKKNEAKTETTRPDRKSKQPIG